MVKSFADEEEDKPHIKTVGLQIKFKRAEKGWSVPELAKKIGFSEDSIWRIEKGYVEPNEKILRFICHALDLKIEYEPAKNKSIIKKDKKNNM